MDRTDDTRQHFKEIEMDCHICGSTSGAAKDMCNRCYQRHQYKEHGEERRAYQRAYNKRRTEKKHDAILLRLSKVLIKNMPESLHSAYYSWEEATMLYNHANKTSVHFLALCRAVMAQGRHYGMEAHDRRYGGMTITKRGSES